MSQSPKVLFSRPPLIKMNMAQERMVKASNGGSAWNVFSVFHGLSAAL